MPGPADGGIAVAIAAYQAAATIGGVVTGVRHALPGVAVYVVDDGSGDETGRAGRAQGATVLVHPRNLGKGAALRTGIARALADQAAIIVTLDADGQPPPQEIPRLVAPVAAQQADVVLGARARTRAMLLGRRCTNWLSAALASRIGGRAVLDAQTGFRALARRAAELVRPRERGTTSRPRFYSRRWSKACESDRCRSPRCTRGGLATSGIGGTPGAWRASSRGTAERSSSEYDEHPDLERRRHPRPRPRGPGRGLRLARPGHRRRTGSGAERHVALAHAASPGSRDATP